MRTCGPCTPPRKIAGFWSARLRYPTRRVPLKRAGSSLAGPRVNDHRKPMCVTSRGSGPYSRSFTYSHYLSFWVCMRVSRWSPSPPPPRPSPLRAPAPRGKHHRGPRENLPCPSTTTHRWKRRPTGDHFSLALRVLWNDSCLLPSRCQFIGLITASWLAVLARKKSKAGSYGDVKSDLIRRAVILIDDKRFVRFTDIARDYRLSKTSARSAGRAHLRSKCMFDSRHYRTRLYLVPL